MRDWSPATEPLESIGRHRGWTGASSWDAAGVVSSMSPQRIARSMAPQQPFPKRSGSTCGRCGAPA